MRIDRETHPIHVDREGSSRSARTETHRHTGLRACAAMPMRGRLCAIWGDVAPAALLPEVSTRRARRAGSHNSHTQSVYTVYHIKHAFHTRDLLTLIQFVVIAGTLPGFARIERPRRGALALAGEESSGAI